MTPRMRKLVTTLGAMALAGMLAAPALAKAPAPAAGDRDHADAVMFHGKKIGQDPDPFIRNEMLRHADSGWAD